MNDEIVEELEKIKKHYDIMGDQGRKIAY
jgi:DNA polymerase/3'-5' exonuclease PolX